MTWQNQDDKSNGGDKRPQGNNPWEGPPDPGEALKMLFKRRKKMSSPPPGGGSDSVIPGGKGFGFMLGLIIVIAIVVWGASGFYVVQPAEKAIVLRLGQYTATQGPGLHWLPRFIDSKYVINIDKVSTMSLNELMLTSGENIADVEFAVQYRVADPKEYLFNVINPVRSLSQIIDSAVRQVIGTSKLDDILTIGRMEIATQVKAQIIKLVKRYRLGLDITDVAMQPAKAPEAVKAAFDDVIKAREDNQRIQNEAEGYANKVIPVAQGQAQKFLQQAAAYKSQVIYRAEGAVAQFDALLPKYVMAPRVTSERMYLSTMQNALEESKLVFVDNGKHNGNFYYLPLNELTSRASNTFTREAEQPATNTLPVAAENSQEAAPQGQQQAAYLRWREANNAS